MNRNWITLLFLFNSILAFSQQLDTYYSTPKPFPDGVYPKKIDSSGYFNPKLMAPIIGAGPGVLTFYGDIQDKSFLTPSLTRLGYHLSISEYISRSLMISARAMFGVLGGNENSPRYMNFESSIRSGGLHLTYNFDNFLPIKRKIDPFVLTGIEYFEFLSKADFLDKSGNQYYYWSNGSIMNVAENDPNAANAIALSRDYTYETDLRKWNQEFFGKYPERSFSIPVGIGVTFHLTPRIHFKLGTTMHFAFTDYIDGITPENKGVGKAKSNKDKFIENYFTISFDLFNPKPPYVSPVTEEELMAMANEDSDKDGVIDFTDSCQGTPEGVAVDAKGCPLDSDNDRFPDYLDKEPNSPAGAIVDDNGVAMSDSTLAQKWRIWSDTANVYTSYSDTIVNAVSVFGGGGKSKEQKGVVVYRRELVVLLENYKSGVPPEDMNKLLSIPDVRSQMQSDSSASYITGSYGILADAEKRRDEMKDAGFPNATVMVLNRDGALASPTADALSDIKPNKHNNTSANVNMKGVVYRVQLGAYSKKLSPSIFRNAGEIIQMKTEDNLYKYMSGSNTTVQEAMKQRDELMKKGYNGAFVVAYKNGKRVPLSTVSGGIIAPKNENLEEPKHANTAIDKNLISFRVQVGSYTNEPPADVLQKYKQLPSLTSKRKASGTSQYFAGKFKNYDEAKRFCNEIISSHGIKDAFVVAFFKEEMISIQEALELIK